MSCIPSDLNLGYCWSVNPLQHHSHDANTKPLSRTNSIDVAAPYPRLEAISVPRFWSSAIPRDGTLFAEHPKIPLGASNFQNARPPAAKAAPFRAAHPRASQGYEPSPAALLGASTPPRNCRSLPMAGEHPPSQQASHSEDFECQADGCGVVHAAARLEGRRSALVLATSAQLGRSSRSQHSNTGPGALSAGCDFLRRAAGRAVAAKRAALKYLKVTSEVLNAHFSYICLLPYMPQSHLQ